MDRLADSLPTLPTELGRALLHEAATRDMVTARRWVLLSVVWCEAYLSAAGLMSRVRAVLGAGCFGQADVAAFRRDMRAIKVVLQSAGRTLKFSRRPEQGGYYVQGRPPLDPELAQSIRSALSDLDLRQIELAGRLSAAQRVWQAGRLSDQLRRMAVRRLRRERPNLSLLEARREVLDRYEQRG